MYQLFVLEDDAVAAGEAVRAVVESPYGDQFAASVVSSSSELKALLDEGAICNVLVADIRLGGGGSADAGGTACANGIQAVRELLGRGSSTQVIYLTGYIEYCTEVYETDHVYFLTKPICQADFDKALARALSNLEEGDAGALPVKAGRLTVLVPFREIAFVESRLRKLEVHTASEVYETYGTVNGMVARLPKHFVVTHRSFIVNLDHVRRFDSEKLMLDTGEQIPVSKYRRIGVREAFFSRLGR